MNGSRNRLKGFFNFVCLPSAQKFCYCLRIKKTVNEFSRWAWEKFFLISSREASVKIEFSISPPYICGDLFKNSKMFFIKCVRAHGTYPTSHRLYRRFQKRENDEINLIILREFSIFPSIVKMFISAYASLRSQLHVEALHSTHHPSNVVEQSDFSQSVVGSVWNFSQSFSSSLTNILYFFFAFFFRLFFSWASKIHNKNVFFPQWVTSSSGRKREDRRKTTHGKTHLYSQKGKRNRKNAFEKIEFVIFSITHSSRAFASSQLIYF